MKNIIAKSTQITTQFASAFNITDTSKIKEYRNKNIGYDGKIYQTLELNDTQKQLNKDFFNKAKIGLDKISDQQLYKQFFLNQNSKQLKDLIQIITIGVVNDSDLLYNSIGAKATSKYVFIPRGKQQNQQEENEDDKSKLIIDFCKDTDEQIEEKEKQFLTNSKNLFKTFKTNFANSDKNTIQREADKASDDLLNYINTLLQEYETILTKIENEYSKTNDQKIKQYKQNFEKRIQKVQNQKDKKIDQFINKCKSIKSKYQKMNIKGEDRKVEIIKQFTDGYIVKQAGNDYYSVVSKHGALLDTFESLNDQHYRLHDKQQCFRILNKQGQKSLFPYNDFLGQILNAFIVDTDKINEDFSKDYFVVSEDGNYQIRKIADGITGTPIETKNNFSQLKQYIKNFGSSTTTTSSSMSSTTTSSFDIGDYDRATDKKDYLHNLSQDEIDLSGITDNRKKMKILRDLSGTGKSFKLSKTIKISRKNRHLSLEQLALNSIFKRLNK